MPGSFTPITEPEGISSLAGFHAALAALAEGKRERVRIAMYGASGTASDLATGYLREYVQTRFGGGGPGFVPLVPLSRWYAHQQVEVRASSGWQKQHAQVRTGPRDGRYGYLGASFATSRPGQWAEVRTQPGALAGDRVATLELHLLAQPGGGSLRVEIDGRDRGVLSTAAEASTAAFHVFPVDPGPHVLRVTTLGDGDVRVFGVAAETDRPGVVVDTLGIDGTRATNHVDWDEAIWTDSIVRRGVDLVTFSYGTNEASDEEQDMSLEAYREHLTSVLARLRRAMPEVGCLLLGPGDFPILVDGRPEPRPRLMAIVEIQRDLAPRFGCGFWDGLAFMGGAGSMRDFVESDPPLARADYLHFNRLGSARKAQAQVDALMWALDAHSGFSG